MCKQHYIDYNNADTLDTSVPRSKLDRMSFQKRHEDGKKSFALVLSQKKKNGKKALNNTWSQKLADELHNPLEETSFDAVS